MPGAVLFRQQYCSGEQYPVNSSLNEIYCRIADDEAEVMVTTRTGAEDGSDQETDPNAALIPNLMRNGAGSSSSPVGEGRISVGA